MNFNTRSINENDLAQIMAWRMDADITKYMNTDPILTIEKQKEWLNNISNRKDVKYWIIEVDEMAVGVINLANINEFNKTASWGYYIGEKKARSLLLAISIEMSLYDYIFDVLKFKELNGDIFSKNENVIKLHLACGSTIVKEVKGAIEKNGLLYDVTYMHILSEEWFAIRNGKKYISIKFN